MKDIPTCVRVASFVQIGIAAGNLVIPYRLRASQLLDLGPPVRQIVVQRIYVMLTIAALGALWLLFSPELNSRSALGRGSMALFWGTRLGIERLYYDGGCRPQYRWADAGLSLVFLFLTLIFAHGSWVIR